MFQYGWWTDMAWYSDYRKRTAALTTAAHQVLDLAREEAAYRNEHHVGAEFLLLGLIRHSQVQPSSISMMLGHNRELIYRLVEDHLGVGEHEIVHQAVLAPRSVRILRLALEEAQQLGQTTVGPEHVLLGILREGNSMAAKALRVADVTLEDARSRLLTAQEFH